MAGQRVGDESENRGGNGYKRHGGGHSCAHPSDGTEL